MGKLLARHLSMITFAMTFKAPKWYLWNNLNMIKFNPQDPGDIPYKFLRIVKESSLSLQQICDRMKAEFGVELTASAISKNINNGTLSLQRALQLLAICRVSEIGIVSSGSE